MSRNRDIVKKLLSLPMLAIASMRLDKKGSAKWHLAVAYLWVIVLFAFLYSLMEGHFYYANSSRELGLSEGTDTVREDKVPIGKELEGEILKTIRSASSYSESFDHWRIDSGAFEVRFLRATNKGGDVEIAFKLATKLIDVSEKSTRLFVDLRITFLISEITTRLSRDDPKGRIYLTIRVNVPEAPSVDRLHLVKALFTTDGTSAAPENVDSLLGPSGSSVELLAKVTIPISKPLNDRIVIFGKGIQGDPTSLPGNFWRMMYFSVVTITTLGTNDISPLTTLARMLMTLEVVIGVTIVGLFLNAIAAKHTRE